MTCFDRVRYALLNDSYYWNRFVELRQLVFGAPVRALVINDCSLNAVRGYWGNAANPLWLEINAYEAASGKHNLTANETSGYFHQYDIRGHRRRGCDKLVWSGNCMHFAENFKGSRTALVSSTNRVSKLDNRYHYMSQSPKSCNRQRLSLSSAQVLPALRHTTLYN